MSVKPNIGLGSERPAYHLYILWLLAVLCVIRFSILLISPYNLHGDEAQYWAWSKDLSWGYFTKPPAIAAVIALTTSIWGDAEWAVRAAAPILHMLTAFVIFRTAMHLYDARTGFWAGAIYALMPALWLSSQIISTDVPLLLCWAIALNAWVHLRERPTWLRAIQFGMALGLGVLCKYALLFFFPALLACLYYDRQSRQAILSLKGLLALGLFVLWLTPNIIWNMNHDFATLNHTVANADMNTEHGFSLHSRQLLEFWVGQFLVFGPVSLILVFTAILAVFRNRLDKMSLYLSFFTLSPWLIISFQALLSRADLNWAVTAYVGAPILAAHFSLTFWSRWGPWLRHSLTVQTGLCLVVCVIYMSPSWVNALGRANDVKRLRGWPETVVALNEVLNSGYDGHAYQAVAMDKRIHFYALNYYGIGTNTPLYMWLYKAHPDNNHAEITHPLPTSYGPYSEHQESSQSRPILIVNYQDKPAYHKALSEDFKRLIALPDLDVDLGGGQYRRLKLWVGYDYQPTSGHHLPT